MKKLCINALLILNVCLLNACAYDVQHYVPAPSVSVVTPAHPVYINHNNYHPPKPYYVKPPHNKHYHNYNEHHDNGKHKGQYKNKHHDHDHDD